MDENEEFLEVGPNCCIYKVPQYLRKINEEAYTPKSISIGPLHYGRKELMGMESQKRRYGLEFRRRLNNAQQLNDFETYIQSQEQTIRGYYSVTSNLQSSEYVKIILGDAVFIIELFMRYDTYPDLSDFLVNNNQYLHPITNDLLLLENQIPYFVLNHLYSSVFTNSSFFDLCLKFFKRMEMFNWSFSEPENPSEQLKHFTDFLRFAVVGQVEPIDELGGIIDLPCATKLQKSGLQFKGIIDQPYLHQIDMVKGKLGKLLPWFGVNELQIPCIIISDVIETYFRNLMALEIFHYPELTYICHYADLMDHLIDTDKDVDLLVEKEIIVNYVGDIDVIVRMFNGLNSEIAIGNSPYHKIAKDIKAHYKYRWNQSKATLKSVYFNNVWTGTATVAAAFLLILTLLQTIYSIKK